MNASDLYDLSDGPSECVALVSAPAEHPALLTNPEVSARTRHQQRDPRLELLPLPHGASSVQVTRDGIIVYDNGQARGVLCVSLMNLGSLGELEQEDACGLFARLATTLTPGQTAQITIDSNPIEPTQVTALARQRILTRHADLRTLADHSLTNLERAIARTHVPDKSAYLVIGPPLERSMGLSGALTGLREVIGLNRHPAPDLYGIDAALDDAAGLLHAAGLASERLNGPAVTRLLWQAINPDHLAPTLPLETDLTPLLCPVSWSEGFDALRIGGIYTRSLLLMDPPDVTDPGWLDELLALDVRYRLSWHLGGRDHERERSRQVRRRRMLHNLATTTGRLTDLDGQSASLEAEHLAEDMVESGTGVISSTVILTLQARSLDELERSTRRAARIIRTRYGLFGRGRGHQRALWRASLPFGVDTSSRARRWHSASIGNGLPFLAHSPGTPGGFPLGFTTRGGELVTLDLSHPSTAWRK